MVLRYFGVRVIELERSIKFYTELLGLRKRRQGRMWHGGKWVLLEDPRSHQRLELNWYPDNSPFASPYMPGNGLDHIGFKVKDPASTFKRLIAKGAVSALSPRQKWCERDMKDPDGNWAEFF